MCSGTRFTRECSVRARLNLACCCPCFLFDAGVCEGDGECQTDRDLNNCNSYDVYVRLADPPYIRPVAPPPWHAGPKIALCTPYTYEQALYLLRGSILNQVCENRASEIKRFLDV